MPSQTMQDAVQFKELAGHHHGAGKDIHSRPRGKNMDARKADVQRQPLPGVQGVRHFHVRAGCANRVSASLPAASAPGLC